MLGAIQKIQTQVIKSDQGNKWLLRPRIYNKQITVTGSSASGTMGIPSDSQNGIITISPNQWQWIKTAFVTSSGTRAVAASIRNSGSHLPFIMTQNDNTGNNFQGNFARLDILSGTGSIPSLLRRYSRILNRNEQVLLSFADISGYGTSSSYTLYLSMIGIEYLPFVQNMMSFDTYSDIDDGVIFPAQSVEIAGNGQQTLNFVVNTVDFMCDRMVFNSTGTCLVTIEYMSIPLTDSPMHSSCLQGEPNVNGNPAFILPAPFGVIKGGQIQVTIQDISGANNEVSCGFYGAVLYSK